MQQITPQELSEKLREADNGLLLLDVREPHEFRYCRIDGSVNLPIERVFAGLNELDPEREIVTICHHGMRSAQVANFLLSHGFKKISNLRGGVAAWAEQVDPSMPRY
jgi:rhodanese-related sulfurtransferase